MGRPQEVLPAEELWGSGFVHLMACSRLCLGLMKSLSLEEDGGPVSGGSWERMEEAELGHVPQLCLRAYFLLHPQFEV